jgi:hypothetical protein
MWRPSAALVVCLLVLGAARADARRCGDDVDGRGTAVPCDCGDLLVGSRTLGADDPITTRACPATGLLVQVAPDRPAATLSLGGRVLAGSGRGFGIHVLSGGTGGMTIAGPGEVRGFATGVLAARGSVARLANVTASDNRGDGFVVAGDGYSVVGCEARRNDRDGFALRGASYRSEGNRALENGRTGFVLAGRDAAMGGTAGNEATDNGGDGLNVRGRRHDVRNALASGNGQRRLRASLPDAALGDGPPSGRHGRRDCRGDGTCR